MLDLRDGVKKRRVNKRKKESKKWRERTFRPHSLGAHALSRLDLKIKRFFSTKQIG